MAMNFFKKVITFFSAIWNAISWRKSDKKGKQAAKSVESVDQTEKISNLISETDKLFVDVPLDSPGANNLSEQELLTKDENPAVFTPIVAHNIELQTGPDPVIRNYSSGVQQFGFEETSPTLSFFSEPLRSDSEISLLLPIKERENNNGPDANESTVCETVGAEVVATRGNEATDVLEFSVSEELHSPPNDPIPEDAVGAQSASDNRRDVTCLETVPLTSLNDGTKLETLHPSYGDLASTSTHHFATFKTKKISSDLNYLAIGDDEHLFPHEVTDIRSEFDEQVRNETAYKLVPEVLTLLEVEDNDSKNDEQKRSTATSSDNVTSIGVSVSTQAFLNAHEHTTERSSNYSTNYLVKSDSLVNFLPEVRIDSGLSNNAGLLMAPKKSMTPEDETKVLLDNSTSILKEGGLDEMMCTSRGVLKLSGDHHVDLTAERSADDDDSMLCHDVKTSVDGSLMDDFAFEEPLVMTHLEGNIVEGTPHQLKTSDNIPIFLPNIETRLDGNESVDELDTITDDQLVFESESIRGYRSVIREVPVLQSSDSGRRIVSQNGGPDENDENRKSHCKVSQFTTFHLDDDPRSVGHSKKSDFQARGTTTIRLGEIPAINIQSEFVPSDRDTSSQDQVIDEGSSFSKQFLIGPENNIEFFRGPNWSATMKLPESEEVINHESSPNFLDIGAGTISVTDERGSGNSSEGDNSHLQDCENLNDYYPFIDCSSYLFSIPKEIRKENTFNPCVGAAPSRKSNTNDATSLTPSRYSEGHAAYAHKYSNMNSLVPTCVGTVPLSNTCIAEQYKNTRVEKLPDGYTHLPLDLGTFWGVHPGLDHSGEQQQAFLGYSVSSNENYYDGENLDSISTAVYDNDQTTVCLNPEGHGYINPYGALEFPMLSIPLCGQPPTAFMTRGTLTPVEYPVGPMNASENRNSTSAINLQATTLNEGYSVPRSWVGCPANSHLQNDDEVREIELAGGMALMDNISCPARNEDDDDFDNNPVLDPYLQLAENNSLHTVKSKADSYSGSLFCESLRSLISHNTENENIFPSFSCSSVQGCCPSIVLQSCETTVSNESLPSIFVEEPKYSRSVDEDYLATEKFMNDVNTALNESVLDQIQGQVDLHSNLLGRGDGSMSIGPGHSGNSDQHETSLGENISINNSKLTLLDGILGSDGGGNEPEHNDIPCAFEGGSSNLGFFRNVVDTIVEGVIIASSDGSAIDLESGLSESDVNCEEQLDVPGNQSNLDRDLVVQNMIVMEGMPGEPVQRWPEGSREKLQECVVVKEKTLPLDEAAGDIIVSDMYVEEALKKASDQNIDSSQEFIADDPPNSRRSRRNRRQRKKRSDVDPVKTDLCTEVPYTSVGDSAVMKPLEPSNNPVELRSSSGTEHAFDEAELAMPKADGEHYTNETLEESSTRQQDFQQIEDEDDGLPEEGEEPGENSGNPSGYRRRRNRRRKRRN